MDARKVVGDNVRRFRDAAGLTQAELAALMGIDRAYISGLELGERNPTVITVWHTATALGVKPHQLLEDATGPTKPPARPTKAKKPRK